MSNERRSSIPALDPEDRTAEFSIAELATGKARPTARQKLPALTAIAGRALGRVFRLTADAVVIGRADDAAVCIQDEGVSRKHARIDAHGDRHVIVDLGSKNGTLVNDALIRGPVFLQEGDAIRMGPHTILRYARRDELDDQLQERLYDWATRDPLTQAVNRRAFDERLLAEWSWAKRHDRPVAICILDADHFKRVNDAYGHGAGDHVLKTIADLVHGIIRKEDVFARIGGEEFAVLLRATNMESATIFAERIRATVEQQVFSFEDQRITVTVSLGVSTSADPGIAGATELVARADAALYKAKSAGRNKVVAAT